MSISLVGTVNGSDTGVSNIILTLPTLAQYDVVYVGVANKGTPAMLTAGYSQVGTASSNGFALSVFRKVMGATPDTQAVVTASAFAIANSAAAICLSGVDSVTPEDATATTATGSSTNPDPASITTASANSWVLTFAGSNVNDAAVTLPAGYSNSISGHASGFSASSTTGGATKLVAVAGAENPGTWTNWDSGDWACVTVAARLSTGSVPVAAVDSLFMGMM